MIISEAKRIRQVGEYYFSGKLKEIAALRQQGRDIINLGIGSPDLSPSPDAVDVLCRTARQPGSHGYQSYTGIPELRDAIADYMFRFYSVRFDPQTEVLPLIGSKEGIMHITMAFVDPGDKVLIPDPGYPTYSAVTRIAQAETVSYPLDESADWSIDFDYLSRIDLDEVKLMWVNYPHMPTGAGGSPEDFSRLVKLAAKHHFLIVNDNPYGQLHDGEQLSIFQAEGSREVCLELNSMSKSHNMAGWRVGWVCGEYEYLKMILRVKSNMDSGMFLPVQKAAVRALAADKEWFEHIREIYARRRRIAFSIMDTLECRYSANQQGMFVWGKAPDNVSEVAAWSDEMLEHAHVFITPGFIFGNAGERYLRISLCANEGMLQEALERLVRFKGN